MTSDCHLNLSGASVYEDLEDLPLTLFGPGLFYCLGPGGSLGTFLNISEFIQASSMNLCTGIVLLKVYQNM